jgi:ABC-2 type transport system ATP-binding protein
MILIKTDDLTKRFETLTAVEGVSLRIGAGEILVLLGPNGAGKTTTIRMLASILRPTRGRAEVAGFDTQIDPVSVRRSVGLLTEHHGLYTRMRAREYLQFFGRAYGMPEEAISRRIEELSARFGLREVMGRRLGEFSKGMRQKLTLIRALLHEPPVLLLDEPTSAMDPESARLVREGICRLRSAERAIVVCTHNLTEAELLADQIAIIQHGRVVAQGTPAALKQTLGDPIMELRLGCTLDGALRHLPSDLKTLEVGRDWIRYRAARPEDLNPQVLAAMSSAGVPVVTLSEVGRTLEEVYLQVVGAETPAEVEDKWIA